MEAVSPTELQFSAEFGTEARMRCIAELLDLGKVRSDLLRVPSAGAAQSGLFCNYAGAPSGAGPQLSITLRCLLLLFDSTARVSKSIQFPNHCLQREHAHLKMLCSFAR